MEIDTGPDATAPIGSSVVLFVDDLAVPLAYGAITTNEASESRITLSAGGNLVANALGVLEIH